MKSEQLQLRDKGFLFTELYEVYKVSTDNHTYSMNIATDILNLLDEYEDRYELLKSALQYSNKCKSQSIYPYIKGIMDNWQSRGIMTPNDVIESEKKRKEEIENKSKNLKPHYSYSPTNARKEIVPEWLNNPEHPSNKPKEYKQDATEDEKERAKLIAELNHLNKGFNRPTPKPIELYTIEELKAVIKNVLKLNYISGMIIKKNGRYI